MSNIWQAMAAAQEEGGIDSFDLTAIVVNGNKESTPQGDDEEKELEQ